MEETLKQLPDSPHRRHGSDGQQQSEADSTAIPRNISLRSGRHMHMCPWNAPNPASVKCDAARHIPHLQQLQEGWQTGFEPATAGTTSRSSTN
jgi:hypothetical protein